MSYTQSSLQELLSVFGAEILPANRSSIIHGGYENKRQNKSKKYNTKKRSKKHYKKHYKTRYRK